MDEKELAKQLSTYADSITAFAFVQGVTFCLLIAQNVSLACAVRSRWYIAAPLMAAASVAYFLLVRRCQDAEDDLIGVPAKRSTKIGKVVPMIRATRSGLILVIGVGEIALVIGVRLLTPLFPCSPTSR
jgi:hypothetical protein